MMGELVQRIRTLFSRKGDNEKKIDGELLAAQGKLPSAAVACVGGGSNAAGLFAGFVDDAAPRGVDQDCAGLHSRQPHRVDNVPRRGDERHVRPAARPIGLTRPRPHC